MRITKLDHSKNNNKYKFEWYLNFGAGMILTLPLVAYV